MTDTISKKDLHLAACAAAKVEGDARRAKLKAERVAAHRAFLDGLIADGAARKAERVKGHQDRNAALKVETANDAAPDEVAA